MRDAAAGSRDDAGAYRWRVAIALSELAPSLVVVAMWCGASLSALGPVVVATEGWRLVACAVAPVLGATVFVAIGGMAARLCRHAITPGQFPRSAAHRVYGPRRVYSAAWTQVYYCRPLYAALLTIPPARACLLWLFGYQGGRGLLLFPDTWIRDLPLLRFGHRVYLANRATIGTNISLHDGTSVVGPVTLGDDVLIGHLAIVGPFARIGEGSQLGVSAIVGIGVRVGAHCVIQAGAGIDHFCRIGAGTTVGAGAYVGDHSRLGPGLRIAPAAVIPAGSTILTQEAADACHPAARPRPSALDHMALGIAPSVGAGA